MMWEKINKMNAQVIACMIIIIGSYLISFYAGMAGLQESSLRLIDKVTDISLTGAVAWLFTMSKNGSPPKPIS